MQTQSPQGGTIVNISSINGLGGARGASLYSMSKAAIVGFTKSAAIEYASDFICVNALVAGGFDTDMLRNAIRQIVGDDPDKLNDALKSYETRTSRHVSAIRQRPQKLFSGFAVALPLTSPVIP